MTEGSAAPIDLRGLSALVTGGRGSLGQRLVRRLAQVGTARVVAFDLSPAESASDHTDGRRIEHVVGSILSADDLREVIAGCTVVFHLAALVHAGRSAEESERYMEVNARGTALLMDACADGRVDRVVYTSTSHVYGVPERLPVDEDHPTAPLTAYAASKLAAEWSVADYAAKTGRSAVITRMTNLYGASSGADTVVVLAMSQALSGGPIRLRSLRAERDFLHADDAVEALVRLAVAPFSGNPCQVVNVSTGRGVSIRELADAVSRLAAAEGFGRPAVVEGDADLEEPVPALVLDNRRLQELTGWTPEVGLEQGLRTAFRELQEAQPVVGSRR